MTPRSAAVAVRAPAHACDSHFHVFERAQRFPYAAGLRYRPPYAPLDDYLALARKLGIERYVFVQPSAYGRDNRCLIEAMTEVRNRHGAVCRGIVDVDEDADDAELARLDAIGVRGVRINVSPVQPPQAGLAAALEPRILCLAERCRKIGWHLDFLLPGWLTLELLPLLERLRVDFSLAHLGMFPACEGSAAPGFRRLLDLMRGGERRCWVKLTGIYRISAAPGYADAAPMVQAVVQAAPDRVIWGSDYPHLSFADRVGSVELFALFAAWVPDQRLRERILVENPARLYGFT